MPMIKVSERLKMIAEMVTALGENGVVADIGCDHCLTLMYLLENNICARGIGSDVKAGPLEKAHENLLKFGYDGEIELRLGNGLATIAKNEADAIIISGMGGGLINDIVSAGRTVAKTAEQLVIQPQNDVCAVRKSLHRLGFSITDEKMAYEQGKFYAAISAVPTLNEEKYENETYYLYGKLLIHNKDKTLARFLRERLAENGKIASALSDKKSENSVLRLAEIENENSIIREVLSWL